MALQNYEVDIDNLSKEDREQFLKLVSQSKIKKTWKPQLGEEYWYINSIVHYDTRYWMNDNTDNYLYALGNCFKTRKETEFAVERLKVITELKRYAKENNTEVIDWSNNRTTKYYLAYDKTGNQLDITFNTFLKHNDVYFSSKEIAQAAINTIGKDRLKKYYFNVTDDEQGDDN